MDEFKFKIGDIVIVKNDSLDSYGAIGNIINIDENYEYPYEVEFLKNYEDTLFCDSDLALHTSTHIKYINLQFQDGAIKEVGVNGCQIEDVIDVLIDRLTMFQSGNFPCRENALAITKLEEARMWLNERTRKREEQGVEGKNENHGG